MKFFAITSALAVSVLASPGGIALHRRQSAFNTPSAVSVLETALPSSLLALAATNTPGLASEVSAEFANGMTPGWFQSLPADVKTWAVGAAIAGGAATPTPSVGATMPYGTNNTMGGVAGGTGAVGGAGASGRATSTGSRSGSTASGGGLVGGPTGTGSGSSATAGGAGGAAASSAKSTGAAALPTAAAGAGFAGIVGLAALLAL